MGYEEMLENDSFTIGTASTGGVVKVYFKDVNADEKIKTALRLYQQYVEFNKIRKQL